MKMKDSESIDKYLDLARELKTAKERGLTVIAGAFGAGKWNRRNWMSGEESKTIQTKSAVKISWNS